MPRPRNPANEPHRTAQERYRDNLRIFRGTETDEAHAALAVALAIFRHQAEHAGSIKNVAKVDGLERLAARYLAADGKDFKHALRAVRLRTRRLDVDRMIQAVNSVSEGDGAGTPPAVLVPPLRFA